MAFGENDIKINVTLETQDAIRSVEQLKGSIESTLKGVESQFKKIAEVSKTANSLAVEQVKANARVQIEALRQVGLEDARKSKEKLAQIQADLEAQKNKTAANIALVKNETQQEISQLKIASSERIKLAQAASAERRAITDAALQRELANIQAESKATAQAEATKRAELKKTLKEVEQQTAIIRKSSSRSLETSGAVPSIAKTTEGLGKSLPTGPAELFKNSIAGISTNIGGLNIGVGALIKNLGPLGQGLAGLVVGAKVLNSLNQQIDQLAQSAGSVAALRTGFETLQRSVGQGPVQSIEALREATRGLVSDVKLYQRANQAVLLGVPTKVFNEAAAAAVKLGRAMGIDAAFGLESLSLGLGRQSRLYLDNLGIVVSAEQAYASFALTLGKTAEDLTDSEKRAAFFAEALKKIEERARELPEPFDDVGVSLQKLQVAQENNNKSFLEGFNSSKALAAAYQEQIRLTKQLEESNYIYGRAAAAVAGGLKELGNIGISVFNQLRLAGADALNVFGLDRQSEIAEYTKKIQANEESIKRLAQENQKLIQSGIFKPKVLAGNVQNIKSLEEEIVRFKNEVARLNSEINDLNNNPLKPTVDLTEIATAQAAFKALFKDFRAGALEEIGVIEIPGFSAEQTQGLISQVAQIKKSLGETKDVNAFNKSLSDLQGQLSTDIIKVKVADIAQAKTKLDEQLAKDGDRRAYEQGLINLGKITEEVTRSAFTSAEAQKAFGKAFSLAGKQASEAARERASAVKASEDALKAQKRQIDDLVRSVRRITLSAIPPEFERRLNDLFGSAPEDSKEFEDGLRAIAREAQAAGVDLTAFGKSVRLTQDLLAQGVPLNALPGSQEAKQAAKDYNDALQQIQSTLPNIRELLFGKPGTTDGNLEGGGFFGFDLGEATPQQEADAARYTQAFFNDAFQAGVDGFSREDVPAIAQSAFSAAGAALATSIGVPPEVGAAVGSAFGQIIGDALAELGADLPGTKERKNIDKYFSELFDSGRLAVVISGQIKEAVESGFGAYEEQIREIAPTLTRISDLIFEGFTPFAGQVSFGGEGFFNYFNTLASGVQNAFNGIGLAIGTLQGISVETARLIGVALANNIGGSLQNLQVLVQATGESFDDLANAIVKGFLDAQLTIEEAYNALVQLENLYGVGIPGAVGAYQEAIDNLNASLKDNAPGRYAIDSLRDIGAEGQEAGRTFEAVISSLATTFEFTAQQQTRLFEALRINGITSLAQLQAASNEQLLAILRNIQLIRENATAPLVTTPRVAFERPRGGGGQSEQEKAKKLLEDQRKEARKLLEDSKEYATIITRINEKQIGLVEAGKQILALEREIFRTVQLRDKFQAAFDKELGKGRKADKALLADLAAALKEIEERLKKAAQSANGTNREYKQLNISGILPLIQSQNDLGLIARQVGVDLQKNIDILVKGFIQGRLSISDVNDEIAKTKDLLGPGIPGAIGAVTDAFQNLINAGEQGGQFSLDAFTDIFAEFREKFNAEGSALRKAQGDQLRANVDTAREAYNTAVGPDALAAAKKTLDAAEKALTDFYAKVPAPDLSDLRVQLETAFGPDQVALFFQALGESGLSTFDEFEKAGNQTIIQILGRLKELGFEFGTTSDNVKNINTGLQDAEKSANGGLDPLKQAIDLVKQFNQGAGGLPPVFDATTNAIKELNGPLSTLASGFEGIIEKLALLSGQTFENDVVFNIRTIGSEGGKALVDIIFGDGSDIGSDTGGDGAGGNTGGTNQTAAQRAKIRLEMAKLKKQGLDNPARRKAYNRLREKLRSLGG
jgi:hypothetical protein